MVFMITIQEGSKKGADKKDRKELKRQQESYYQQLSEKQKKEIKKAFDLFDPSGTGTIEARELKVALRALGFDPTTDDVKKLIANYDLEHTGKIDFFEFLSILIAKIVTICNLYRAKKMMNLIQPKTLNCLMSIMILISRLKTYKLWPMNQVKI